MNGNVPGRSLLLVHEPRMCEKLGPPLVARGFDVRVAHTATHALALAAQHAPRYAVVALKLPDQSGLRLIAGLHGVDPTTRIVVVTAYPSIETAVEAIKLGAVHYLAKPADADEILAAFARGQAPPLDPPDTDYRAPSLARAEWEHINRVLSDCGHNISEAARRLGIHRRSLQRKLQKTPPH